MKILRILVYLLIINTLLLSGFLISQYTSHAIYGLQKTNVTRIIDGDTIETELGKIRLAGINTPEKSMEGYEEAKNFLSLYLDREIEVEIKEKDRYQRNLAYIFFQNKMINEEILTKGLGHLYYYSEDKYTEKLKKSEQKARKQEIGIWRKSNDKCASCIILIELNEIDPGEYVILKNICDFDCNLNKWTIKDSATHIKKLDFEINPGQEKKLEFHGRVWNDAGDTLYLRDERGLLVLWYRY